MTSTMRFISSACFLLLLWGSSDAAAQQKTETDQLRAGAATADITPTEWPMEMVGSFSRRLATQAWDPLLVRALVLDDGTTKLVIAIVDSCYVPRNVFDDAKQRVTKSTGIAVDHMLMAATHTHTAPAARDRRHTKADPRYVEHLTKGIVEAVERAYAHLEPAEIGWGVAQVPEEVFNRRWFMKPGGIVPNPFGQTTDQVRMNPPRASELLERPAGPTDPDVSVISVRSREGRPIALLANYSLHYVGGVPAGGVSADYFGEFAQQIAECIAEPAEGRPEFVGILSNGTSGDVNNINFREPAQPTKPFENIRRVASRVADAAHQVYRTIEHRSDVTLSAQQRLVVLEKRCPTVAEIERARQFLAAEDSSSLPPLAIPYAKWTLELAEGPPTEELILQALRIGEVGIAAIPCEVFTEIGLEIKEKSPLRPTFTIELANGHYGYLPTPHQHALGGYETWLGSNILEITASEKITAVILELLEATKKGRRQD